MAKDYDHKAIEKKWQDEWAKSGIYRAPDSAPGKKNFYTLVELPYLSGDLHIGHWYAYAAPDAFARMKRMQGYNVLYPLGWDAFGLPAENAAIKRNINPADWIEESVEKMGTQIRTMGNCFDWDREINTSSPEYMKWTQWLFLQFYKKGLAYRGKSKVNWCPVDQTVLANEQVIDGKCERCGADVVQKEMEQWFMKITEYAERLLSDLEPLEWPEPIKESQRNWIGKSEGAELEFELKFPKRGVRRFVFLHGYTGTPEKCWFPWLKEKLESRGYEVEAPQLPNDPSASDDEQAEYALRHCTFDEHTAVIGHSFGGVVALRLLERGVKVARVILVAAPSTGTYLDGKERPTVTSAVRKGFDPEIINKHASSISLLYDTTDHVVPVTDGEFLSNLLGAPLTLVSGVEPHFAAKKEPEVFTRAVPAVRVFTTRPDTLCGATYLVLAPEHPLIQELSSAIANYNDVNKYLEKVKKKTEIARMADKEKTGVKLEGVTAINPATKEEIPVYVADYVLGGYGTGALMAVPAHDERDLEFARTFNLPIRVVVKSPRDYANIDGAKLKNLLFDICKLAEGEEFTLVVAGGMAHSLITTGALGKHSDIDIFVDKKGWEILEKYLEGRNLTAGSRNGSTDIHEWNNHLHFGGDGVWLDMFLLEKDKDGYSDNVGHQRHRWGRDDALKSVSYEGVSISVPREDVLESIYQNLARTWNFCNTERGILTHSGPFDGIDSEEAKQKIAEAVGGRMKTTYKFRDWLISRQRYWGAPIPIVYDPEGKAHPIPEEHLPWLLPTDADIKPKGTSPLGSSKELKARVEKLFGKGWTPETDTMDGFVDNSWYFLRYLDPKNDKEFSSMEKQKAWMPIARYSGGAEHTTVHVLYSRFFTKALYDMGLSPVGEPYTVRMNRGIILAEDGRKMSKRWGNVVNPDEEVARVGADAVRTYLAFIGPYNETGSFPWSTNGLVGVRRFLERVAGFAEKVSDIPASAELETLLNQSIKKVGEEIEAMKFNTSVSQLMILANAFQKLPSVPKKAYETLLILLAPFAPHLSEELWHEAGHSASIHLEQWPSYDPTKLEADSVTIAVQVSGKTRGTVVIPRGAGETEAVMAAKQDPRLTAFIPETPSRTVYVAGRILNFIP